MYLTEFSLKSTLFWHIFGSTLSRSVTHFEISSKNIAFGFLGKLCEHSKNYTFRILEHIYVYLIYKTNTTRPCIIVFVFQIGDYKSGIQYNK